MTIKRYNSTKDNTIVSAFKENLSSRGTEANMGASDILEIFSIFGQTSTSSLEQARILVEFPINEISEDRDNNNIPSSGSVTFKLKMSNAPHGQTTPKNYSMISHPILRSWSEGDGLDMESYSDKEASNWVSSSANVTWHTTGSDFASSSFMSAAGINFDYSQNFKKGIENLDLNVTGLVEEWIKYHKGTRVNSTGSIEFVSNPTNLQALSIHSHEGKKFTYTFITSSTYSIGNSVFLQLSGTAAGTAASLRNRINSDFAGKIIANTTNSLLGLTQSAPGINGNTIISSSLPASSSTIVQFNSGSGMPNYGMIVKLRDDYENGSKQKSYYTKKFYARSSHEFFLKPQIEAQWDNSVKDDRNYILKSSSLAPAADNLNNIYYYNRFRGSLSDIPSTASSVIVKFFTTLGGTPVSIQQSDGTVSTFVSASRSSAGIYKGIFAYSGSETSLTDVWFKSNNGDETTLLTGSGFTVHTDTANMSLPIPDYVANITNLKPSYLQGEKTTFRVYTRDKNWSPNIYTKATQTAPVNNIREMFYKITKVSDNYEVVSYSTGSTPSYSSLSYDNQGSYFELDMAMLESNNAYQISFVFKDGTNYIELPDKFRFRVDS